MKIIGPQARVATLSAVGELWASSGYRQEQNAHALLKALSVAFNTGHLPNS